MQNEHFLTLKNGAAAGLAELPILDFDNFRQDVLNDVLNENCRVSAFFTAKERRLIAVLADDAHSNIRVYSTDVPEHYDSLTRECPAFHWFERELHEQTGIVPDGHPWLKPIRFTGDVEPAVTNYFTLEGHGTHEVAVGPVHAGVIEPGHFRFQCLGEDVHTLEISLGYQHRGIESMLVNGPDARTPFVMETIAGDTSTANAGAYSAIIQALHSGSRISARAQAIRLVAWELERIANHIGDLGALSGDAAFLPTASFCGRIRGDFLNMTAAICGNRFGRGLVTPDGVGYDINNELAEKLLGLIHDNSRDLDNALDLMLDEPTVLDRFETTGTVSPETAQAIGLVGMAARACGLQRDIRVTHPYGAYQNCKINCVTAPDGDVMSRVMVRRNELKESLDIVNSTLASLPTDTDSVSADSTPAKPNAIAVSLAEGWRGELCHVALTNNEGRFLKYKVVDPSFHNWFGLAMALRNEQISNFPICNKSFNLSYCGHDL